MSSKAQPVVDHSILYIYVLLYDDSTLSLSLSQVLYARLRPICLQKVHQAAMFSGPKTDFDAGESAAAVPQADTDLLCLKRARRLQKPHQPQLQRRTCSEVLLSEVLLRQVAGYGL